MRFRGRAIDDALVASFSRMGAHLVEGADLLAAMLDPSAEADVLAARVREAEQAADETAHEIVKRVGSTRFASFDREDLYRLVTALDDVLDFMEVAVDLVDLHGLEQLPPELAPQVSVLQRGGQLTADAMAGLRSIGGLEEYWIEINRLQNQGGRAHRRIVADLLGGSRKALPALRVKTVADALEQAVDALETVATTIERMALNER